MMKRLFTTIVLCLCITIASAQLVKTITYSVEENPGLRNLMSLLDVRNLNIKITGQLANKTLQLIEHTVTDSLDIALPVGQSIKQEGNTLNLSILSRLMPEDIIRVEIIKETSPLVQTHFPMKNGSVYILMETHLDGVYPQNDIPLFAFTSGLIKSMEINGQLYKFYDYCGLRDAHVSPELWTERLGVTNYVYYTIHIE